jgi:16S rRNA (cytosine967-C5)-methyltransferase
MSAAQGYATHTLAEALAKAARVVTRVLEGASLNAALAAEAGTGRLRAAGQDLAYSTLRAYGHVQGLAERLLDRPAPDRRLQALIFVSLCELESRVAATHTVVHQAVEAASLLELGKARGLVNAVLRGYLRRAGELDAALSAVETARYRHPAWWIERVRTAYPARWQDILDQGNSHPPMGLRVNRRRIEVPAYLAVLAEAGIPAARVSEQCVVLERPRPVDTLPGFSEGQVSVQDAGAQEAALLLDVQDGMTVLDACAAPGGKSGHLLELADCRLTAIDVAPERTRRIEDNLRRLGLAADVRVADALRAADALGGRRFERILLDAPCTASGVARRHPDTKWLRRPGDIQHFASLQAALLEALWQVLEADGKLLYATCSVFPEENDDVLRGFVARHPDARRLPLTPRGFENGQILPSATGDGFYYALLGKAP